MKLLAIISCIFLFLTNCKMSAWRFPHHHDVVSVGEKKVPISQLPVEKNIFMAAVMSSPLIMVKRQDGGREVTRFCSGVLLAGEGNLPRVLTNQHCFRKKVGEETDQIMPDACANTVIYFDQDAAKANKKGIMPKLERRCQRGSLRTSFVGDLAVFTLSEAMPSDYVVTDIWHETEIPANRRAFVIYYPSNPDAAKLQMVKIEGGFDGKAPPKLMNIHANCRIEDRIPATIHQSPQARAAIHKLPYAVAHGCTLVKGNGAGLIDVQTGKLLALHLGVLSVGKASVNIATHAMHLRQFLAAEEIALP